jgi:uncharacterized membrane protein
MSHHSQVRTAEAEISRLRRLLEEEKDKRHAIERDRDNLQTDLASLSANVCFFFIWLDVLRQLTVLQSLRLQQEEERLRAENSQLLTHKSQLEARIGISVSTGPSSSSISYDD